ncbi:hypothetical protein IWW34DRAFT_773635 [Fusarium oxysporum f. sp. albedinis]|nr:hypothetical protein IWW34DRAFT_773635 [Fusarium oxysporum f. sp. albedinis]KAK2470809.1 hypothetical protein H9L39_17040 [Fusarium oxysporum f. sp. albedinis]
MALGAEDGFGRSLFWWARRSGGPRVLELLLQHAGKTGIQIPDDPAPVNAIPILFDAKSAWCDACTLSIKEGCGYRCDVCDSGVLLVCRLLYRRYSMPR